MCLVRRAGCVVVGCGRGIFADALPGVAGGRGL